MNECDLVQTSELTALFGSWLGLPAPACALAVSGGSDSTALMVLFAAWLEGAGEDLSRHVVLTVDHGLRPGSAAETQAVAAQAAAIGFRHATLRWEGPKPQAGIQAAARRARYGLMLEHMEAHGLHILLTGHTRDDQAETLLMRLARGSGLDGLGGMAPRLSFEDRIHDFAADSPSCQMVRPFLNVPRSRLRATLQHRGVPWIDDPSNDSLEFERVRLRAARVQLDALGLTDPMLALSAGRLLRARRAIERTVDRFCSPDSGAVMVHPSGSIALQLAQLRAAEEEIALRALARAIAAAGGSRNAISLAKLETVAASVRTCGERTSWTLSRALISARGDTLSVEREPGREPLPSFMVAPGSHAIWDGRFRISVGQEAEGPLDIRPLGDAAARAVRQQAGSLAADVPLRVASCVPSFWRGEDLLAAPALHYWSAPGLVGVLRAHFLGLRSPSPANIV